MTTRAICQHCDFPLNVCVCSATEQITVPVELVILQHPDESNHAKNTARLIALCIKSCRIVVGQNAQDFSAIKEVAEDNPKSTWVIYPNPQSEPIETAGSIGQTGMPERLILIDATWRKAYKMWQLNPWLYGLPSWHFAQLPENQYRIRKSRLAHSLSTLEATAYSLTTLFDVSVSPLFNTMNAMQQHWQRFTAKKQTR